MLEIKFEFNTPSSVTEASKKVKIRNKGKIQHYFPNDYTVIDIETTDLSSQWGDIIEIGAVKVINNEIIDTFTQLINPYFPDSYELPSFTSELTGISNDEINKYGRSRLDVLADFVKFVDDSIVVAHKASFDINFLYDEILEELNIEFKNNYVDTYNIGHFYAFKSPEMNRHRVIDFISKFNLNNEELYNYTHRALNDVLFEKQIFDLERQKLGDDWVLAHGHSKNKKYEYKTFNANLNADDSNPFYGLNVVFTGTLEKFTRNDAHEFIAKLGATPQKNVRTDTDLLIIGSYLTNTKENNKSSKQIKAENFNHQGKSDISIISDDDFLRMVAEIINK